ncbi:hypothetical protein [Candidatus Methanocrinis natronophilus]|uniref:Uncharacterized protein n=1 Tax=Candidatus Methanocrinis natronophilus TaxID=3033396 RepID=A0ABT5XA31_9EURY|nr:hypothetical protein [Candidatus Methanocrinis natronophilus]MDF0591575.1 hypothetical protein [Candidatus Methanocrinis natronophilus]
MKAGWWGEGLDGAGRISSLSLWRPEDGFEVTAASFPAAKEGGGGYSPAF